jgi:hypothetical protein
MGNRPEKTPLVSQESPRNMPPRAGRFFIIRNIDRVVRKINKLSKLPERPRSRKWGKDRRMAAAGRPPHR